MTGKDDLFDAWTALQSIGMSDAEKDSEGDHGANIVDGLFAIAAALDRVAIHLKYLGNGDAATPMGAIEAFGQHIGEKLDVMANALSAIADKD